MLVSASGRIRCNGNYGEKKIVAPACSFSHLGEKSGSSLLNMEVTQSWMCWSAILDGNRRCRLFNTHGCHRSVD